MACCNLFLLKQAITITPVPHAIKTCNSPTLLNALDFLLAVIDSLVCTPGFHTESYFSLILQDGFGIADFHIICSSKRVEEGAQGGSTPLRNVIVAVPLIE